jgi:putative spermidine/putrescine transport system substrate-binding protein
MKGIQMRGRYGAFLGAVLFIASACSGGGATTAPASATAAAASPSSGVASTQPSPASAKWDEILAAAKGQTVNWYMWGGDETINKLVTGYVKDEAAKLGVTLNQVPITDTVDAVNKVVGEKSAGKNDNGSVDMIWINGENFATMKQGDLLHCGWVHDLPNDKYIDWQNPTVNTDFGLPVGDCEAPWSLAQMAMIYDSAKVPTPPTDAAGLIEWIKANPGKFTYPAIPDFTGSAFVRQMLYYVNGGYQGLLGEFDQAKYDEVTPKLWKLLNELEPYLWREGTTYPQSSTALDQLYANGEVAMDMTYAPTLTGELVKNGTWPATTRQFVFDDGMIGDISYNAIPYNSPHKEGAQVVANILASLDSQYNAIATGVGYPAIDTTALPDAERTRFDNYDFPPSVAPLAVLAKNSNPELQAKWATAIEAGWTQNVLQK